MKISDMEPWRAEMELKEFASDLLSMMTRMGQAEEALQNTRRALSDARDEAEGFATQVEDLEGERDALKDERDALKDERTQANATFETLQQSLAETNRDSYAKDKLDRIWGIYERWSGDAKLPADDAMRLIQDVIRELPF